MATVTPGVLLKLLQSMHTDERVAGEHRSPVLQVTAVVPALTASTSDSLLLPPNGSLLNLSDGLHSTYVQLPPADADALLAARPHLVGHLVHLDRLRFARPVPRAVGLRTVPSSRSLPCVGNPEPLVVRPATCARGYVIQPATSPSDAAPPLMPSSGSSNTSDSAIDAVKRTVLGPKNAVADPAPPPAGSAVKRRFSSPAPSKQRDPSPSVKGAASRASSPSVKGASRASSPAVRGGTPRATSPAPSKCVVPSLVAAKVENRRAAREPAIVVPSRYRQPSPVAGKRGAASPSVGGRRASLSPSSRRLSGEGIGKKKVGVLVAGISKMADLGNGSAMKPGRKSWDDPTMALAPAAAGSVLKSKAKVDKDTILRTQEAISRRLSDSTTEQSSNDDSSVDERPKPRKKIESTSVKPKTASPKITLHDPKWTDGSIPLDALSDKLSKIGKNAVERRDAAAIAAASALQEALITESVIRNLSKFSEICSCSKTSNPLPTVDVFLAVYEDALKWRTIAESAVTNKAEESFLEKSTHHWVDAALATDLEVLKLLNGATDSISRTKSADRPKASSLEPPRTSLSRKQSLGASSKVQTKISPSPPVSCTWSNTESSMHETVELAKTLWCEMHMWFLNFVDEALDVGFHLFEDQNVASKGKHSSHITVVLSQFKKISDWLDRVGKIAEEERTKEKIECLKRKIYGFVISHMGSAFESSVSVSSKS
ncbi:uncharacterized protein LOC120651207 [Panicum virgatum]|uniref:Uncharacterized protein n=1 Tax=Panicum virgatum TaxID=38727 RepID=A0A8T0NKP2_PANVG|nr:uncharacterized protein LOC120651207 [Panicum virgatum]KAG2549458.1 hypothetical protein PVAP13_9KG250700 [Panicum virgatum]